MENFGNDIGITLPYLIPKFTKDFKSSGSKCGLQKKGWDTRKLSIFGSMAIIILMNLLLAITVSGQNEPGSFAAQILDVSDANIDPVINQYPALVLDCYKSGCGPCEEMDTALNEIAQDFRGNLIFGKIDMIENLETKQKFKIRSYPTLLLFDNGILIDRIVGFSSREATEDEIVSSFLSVNP